MPNKKLVVNDQLPKIILPREKAQLFMDWYKKDLYNEKTVPTVFNEGYFVVDVSDYIKIKSLSILELDEVRFGIQTELISEIHKRYDKGVIYYKFLSDSKLQLSSYSEVTGELVCHSDCFDLERLNTERFINRMRKAMLELDNIKSNSKNINIDDIDADLIIDIRDLNEATKIHSTEYDTNYKVTTMWSVFSEKWTTLCVYLLISSFWYLASSKNDNLEHLKISSYQIKSATKDNSKHKKHKNKIRNITNPIYDFGLMRPTSVQKLVSKKQGWKISYEFQVRGHYRHYKSGKTVFIKSYEKGKGLEQKQTILKLNPQ